jgi:single-stranded-DNA-specific exonuclease
MRLLQNAQNYLNVSAFKEKFEKIVADKIKDEQLIPLIEIDTEIYLDEIDFNFLELIKRMAPFGPGNPQPVFVSNQLYVSERPKILKDQHLKFFVNQDGSDVKLNAIGFGLADYYDLIASKMRFSMAYYIEENNFRGNTSLQLRVKDIKFD